MVYHSYLVHVHTHCYTYMYTHAACSKSSFSTFVYIAIIALSCKYVSALQMSMSALQVLMIANNFVSILMDRTTVIVGKDLPSIVMAERVEYLAGGFTVLPQVVSTHLVGLSTILWTSAANGLLIQQMQQTTQWFY